LGVGWGAVGVPSFGAIVERFGKDHRGREAAPTGTSLQPVVGPCNIVRIGIKPILQFIVFTYFIFLCSGCHK
jgi:hypothetical protein